ncbi:MAG: hypothetical protein Ct9H300mP3_11840 [Gammaproteobacteria bacterium]|nr:MAG: hypothetical protein Ct9H300mP3_11840 [Gammaproteobacteria bacterium]
MKKSHIKILYLALSLILSSLSLAEDNIESLKIGFGSCIDEARPKTYMESRRKRKS